MFLHVIKHALISQEQRVFGKKVRRVQSTRKNSKETASRLRKNNACLAKRFENVLSTTFTVRKRAA